MLKNKDNHMAVNNYNNSQVVDFLEKRYHEALKNSKTGMILVFNDTDNSIINRLCLTSCI